MWWTLVVNSLLLGIGLAMDAFSVSLANGLNQPTMRGGRMSLIAGVFALFQIIMPLLGWVLVHTIVEYFQFFTKIIPWVALALLAFIGGKMLFDGVRQKKEPDQSASVLKFGALLVQGLATSIDALSVGLTIAEYDWLMMLVCVLLIGAVTFVICCLGLALGKKFGTKFAGRARILGGIILILIGIEIFITGVFF